MIPSLRNRLVLAVSGLAVIAAGVVVAGPSFAAKPVLPPAAEVAPAAAERVVDTNGWTETRIKGTVIRP